MTQLTPTGLVRILGQVTVILAVPIVGGAVVGLVVDRLLGTLPLWFLVGFGAGNLVAVAGLALLIRRGQRRLRGVRPAVPSADRPHDA